MNIHHFFPSNDPLTPCCVLTHMFGKTSLIDTMLFNNIIYYYV